MAYLRLSWISYGHFTLNGLINAPSTLLNTPRNKHRKEKERRKTKYVLLFSNIENILDI
jgi:hypothetical protein